MDAVYNPWLKPRRYTPPTDIKKSNNKLIEKDVNARKRMLEISSQKQINDQEWDALAEL
ncbi:MAG: hypothetical protein GXO35_07700 [Gammaproteobacteria bacterium]|nr:hypothetical protein [Gammaproteobacteria bacterium]